MAEEAATPVLVDATKAVDEPTRSVEAAEPPKITENKPSDGGDVAPDALDEAPETAAATDGSVAKDTATDAKLDATSAVASGDAAPSEELAGTNGTPAPSKKTNNRRKSAGSVPEHKGKKTPSKKGKKEIKLNLDTKPGDMWMVTMRGYQPWPVIIADEDMLPESLLAKRPVSAMRIDGTYREDFEDEGKNAKDRRYPVMFLGTNEFAWQPNIDLAPFHLDEIKKEVDSGNPGKKNKQLWEAYHIAAEGHDLNYFKDVLASHEQAIQEDELEKEAKLAEKAEKAVKSSKRKSTAIVEDEDTEMGDADDAAAPSAKKSKPSKKRKKDDSEGDDEKLAKTPKTTLKLTNKKKQAGEPKKSKVAAKEEPEPAQPEEPPMTDEERLEKRKKTVLYLRHRLQKGFLTRNQPPKIEDMSAMSGYMGQLEELDNLEPEIIKETKVHKVLKGILKLGPIPRDEEYKITSRSQDLLTKWGTLTAGEDVAEESAAPATNGVKAEEPITEKKGGFSNSATEEAKPKDADGDVPMAEPVLEPTNDVTAPHTNGDAKAEKSVDAVEPAA